MTRFNWRWSEKAHEKWRATRAKGYSRFVFLYGVLGWGLGMFIFMTVLPALFGIPRIFVVDALKRHTTEYLLLGVILWILVGALWGILVWIDSEAQFQKHEPEMMTSRRSSPR